jgi:hypothetical protein
MTRLVTCVTRSDGVITHFWVDRNIMTLDECIREVEMDIAYETAPPNILHGSSIHVGKTADGTKYLRTDRNETIKDNLTELPEAELPTWYINRY